MATSIAGDSSGSFRMLPVDKYDPDAPINFDLNSLIPARSLPSGNPDDSSSTTDDAGRPDPNENSVDELAHIQQVAASIRQKLRAGESESALRHALETTPYSASPAGKALHLSAVLDVLHSIRQTEMIPLLERLYKSDKGPQLLDVLMKYIYRGMASLSVSPPPSSSSTGSSQSPSSLSTTSGGGGAGSNSSPAQHLYGSYHHHHHQENIAGPSAAVLLSWHDKITEVAGLASIMRVITDRRTV